MTDLTRLYGAWARVANGTRMPGTDGVSLGRFGRNVRAELERLATLIGGGEYQAQPLRVYERKIGDRRRVFAVPTVRDRVAQRAALEVLRRKLDADQSEASFAYRKGRSWLGALRLVEECRDLGLTWVVRADIRNYFESIDHDLLEQRLCRSVNSSDMVALIMGWVKAPMLGDNGLIERSTGVPLGAPISAALANHFLADFDSAINGEWGVLVRYADDLVVACPQRDWAYKAGGRVLDELAALRLEHHPDKSYIASFDSGFSFLGWNFVGDGGFEEQPDRARRWVHPMSTGR